MDYRHYISFAITLGVVALGVFCFPNAIPRLIEACRDFGLSCAYYFCELFIGESSIMPTVNDIQSWQWVESRYQPLTILPFTWEEFKVSWNLYWRVFFNGQNLKMFFVGFKWVLYYLLIALEILIPIILLLRCLFNRSLKNENNDYDEETKTLRVCKTISRFTYQPIKRFLRNYIDFVKAYGFWWKIWVGLFAFYFNFYTIFIEFIMPLFSCSIMRLVTSS